MPLENRVDPFGSIHRSGSRGLFTGNRGIIHDPETRTLLRRRWTNPAWIICVLDMPGRRPRDVMGYNRPGGGVGWTELFFLDEVTALAAGHRPCFYCQRQRATTFLGCCAPALDTPSAPELDRRLHRERRASSGRTLPAVGRADIAGLPDGAMVALGDKAFAVRAGKLMVWSFGGYGALLPPPDADDFSLVTPPVSVSALRAGYRPVWHGSAT